MANRTRGDQVKFYCTAEEKKALIQLAKKQNKTLRVFLTDYFEENQFLNKAQNYKELYLMISKTNEYLEQLIEIYSYLEQKDISLILEHCKENTVAVKTEILKDIGVNLRKKEKKGGK